MQIYHYNPHTKEYIGSSEARPSPLVEGEFLTPANSTKIAPPSIGDDETILWNGNGWDVLSKFVNIVTTKKIHPSFFYKIRTNVTCNIEWDSPSEKILKFTLNATPENIAMMQSLVDSHDYIASALREIRERRNKLIIESDWIIQRHQDQITLVDKGILAETTISEQKYVNWLVYRQDLRDLPETYTGEEIIWPIPPEE